MPLCNRVAALVFLALVGAVVELRAEVPTAADVTDVLEGECRRLTSPRQPTLVCKGARLNVVFAAINAFSERKIVHAVSGAARSHCGTRISGLFAADPHWLAQAMVQYGGWVRLDREGQIVMVCTPESHEFGELGGVGGAVESY